MGKQKTSGSVSLPRISATNGFSQWLHAHNVSIGFTARRSNKFFMAGLDSEQNLSLFERSFDHASGLASSRNGDSLFVSGLFQIWHLQNSLMPGQSQNGYDRIYLPQTVHMTGDCGIREIAVDAKGRLIFVNTRFSCLSVVSFSHSFKPIWKPEFITDLLPEDRCHLNGMAVSEKGQVTHVTACAISDVKNGWRETYLEGGVLIDVATRDIVAKGFCLPRSPRIYDHKVWLLNSGLGQLGFIDPETGKFQPVVTCPGFPRGLVFLNHYAIVTVSRLRGGHGFSDLPLQKIMQDHQFVPECGILIIDLNLGKIVHRLQIENSIEELMDVLVLPACQRPMMMGLTPADIKDVFSIESGQIPKNPNGMKNPILV